MKRGRKPDTAIPTQLAVAARRHPKRLALRADDGELTFAALEAASRGAGSELMARGMNTGSAVVVLLPNSVAFAVAAFGIMGAGGVLVPLDPRWGRRELEHVLTEIDPVTIVVERQRQPKALAELLATADGAPFAARLLEVDAATVATWTAAGGTGRRSPAIDVAADAEAAVFYTSGASGRPKAVVHTHRSLSASADGLERRHREFFRGSPFAVLRRTATLVFRYRRRVLRSLVAPQVWLTPISFHAIAGFSLLMQCMLTGQTLVTERRFHPRHTLELVQAHRVTTMALTPTIAGLVTRLPDLERYDLSSLLVVGLGGSLAPPGLVERMRTSFGCAIAIGYGSTELAGGVLSTDLLDPASAQVATVGRPFPGAEVRIVDEGGNVVDVGEQGELVCRSPGLMAGYLDDGRSAVDADGWYHTGDLAFIDGDGRVHVLGRQDDVIVRSGTNVHPAEVEHCILELEGVEEVGVVGGDVAPGEQRVVAYVVVRNGADLDATTVITACRHRMAATKVPNLVAFVATLPRTPEGKLQRYLLRDDASARLRAAGLATIDAATEGG